MSNKGPYRVLFKTCEHDWELFGDVENVGGPAIGNSLFRCSKCNATITMVEKSSIEGVAVQFKGLEAQKQSLKVQEKSARISMWANVIAAIALVVLALILLFGDRVVQHL